MNCFLRTLFCFLLLLSLGHADPTYPIDQTSHRFFGLFRSSDLIETQEQGKIYPKVLKNNNNEAVSILISLSKQKVFLFIGNQVAIESPISSGRRPGWTPQGLFSILEKDPDHRSTIYGNYVDATGHIVRAGICTRTDSAPSGTHYEGAPMYHFMRLTEKGIGMHEGILPGYPASHGCIRLPADMAKLIYDNTPLHTPVTIEE